jgi:hypothetical protein
MFCSLYETTGESSYQIKLRVIFYRQNPLQVSQIYLVCNVRYFVVQLSKFPTKLCVCSTVDFNNSSEWKICEELLNLTAQNIPTSVANVECFATKSCVTKFGRFVL